MKVILLIHDTEHELDVLKKLIEPVTEMGDALSALSVEMEKSTKALNNFYEQLKSKVLKERLMP